MSTTANGWRWGKNVLVHRFLCHRQHASLSDHDRRILEDAVSETRFFAARTTVTRARMPMHFSMLLVDGFMGRHVDDRAGERQLVAVHIPGDFVDLHAYPLRSLDHDVGTITPARVAIVPHERLDGILGEHPALARKMWFSTLLDAAMHRKWLFRLGRLDAVGRVSHFLCEINVRMFAVGLSDGSTFHLPLTQPDLAESCGLTSVHVNRVLRELRERHLCTFRSGEVHIHDLKALARLAEFDPDYLYFDADLINRLFQSMEGVRHAPSS